jgi:UDP-galactopyranose mutase
MPDKNHDSHRIICTGNFSETNNAEGKMTATIEFTDNVGKTEILENLKMIPLHPKYIEHRFTKYTYPIQNNSTREMIMDLKECLKLKGLYLLGRFAEWEYYNMDAAVGAGIDLSKEFV